MASNSMPCSTLEKISRTATAETAMTGPRAAMIKTADSRRRRPWRRITALTGSDQTLAPRPSHSAARKMLDWRRLPLDDLILRLLLDPRVPPDVFPLFPSGPLFVSGPRFPSAPVLPSRG
jgi:hypothetical protein